MSITSSDLHFSRHSQNVTDYSIAPELRDAAIELLTEKLFYAQKIDGEFAEGRVGIRVKAEHQHVLDALSPSTPLAAESAAAP